MTSIIKDGELVDPFRSYIAKSKYARWIDEYGRRETWEETVDRYVNYFSVKVDLTPDEKAHFKYMFLNHKVMPSMRAVMTAGEALERSNVAAYNCAFVAIDSYRAFDESLYILMNGTGIGFSVEQRHIDKLEPIPEIRPSEQIIVFEDSKEGWAQGYREFICAMLRGELPKWDLRRLRPEGSRLKTFGGRSSGPQPLHELLEFTGKIFLGAQGRRLTADEAHEIMCMIGSIVVVGGVRRSALISLSTLNDPVMRDIKKGAFWKEKPHLGLSNNSAVYHEKPSKEQFDEEWQALVDSGTGERGIFNLAGARAHVPERRNADLIEGTNPCAEILLRNMGFCNLSEVIVREDDTLEELKAKVSMASKIGTWQSTMTNFPYLREQWKTNAEEERLLGVSLTGQMSHPVLNGSQGKHKLVSWLKSLNAVAVSVNEREAKRLGINPAAAVTCVKPSGTVSLLTGVASGQHPWHAEYIIRTVRGNKMEPMTDFMVDAGVPCEDDIMNPRGVVFSFPMKAPDGALTRHDMTALQQLDLWLTYKTYWTEHSPSVTVNVRQHEWEEVGEWVYKNFDAITGISFLPADDHIYEQAPLQEITKEEYEKAMETMPKDMHWEMLSAYELTDTTKGSQNLACVAGVCELVNI